jgi:hypothetical protein
MIPHFSGGHSNGSVTEGSSSGGGGAEIVIVAAAVGRDLCSYRLASCVSAF